MKLCFPGRDEIFIRRILEIDAMSYPKSLRGTFASLSGRYRANRESYILCVENSLIVGYFCFFPISPELCEKTENSFLDDDIRADQILPYSAINDIFLISAVVHPGWRDGAAIRLLTQGFKNFLRQKEEAGMRIRSFRCYVVSKDGKRLAERFGMERAHDISASCAFYQADRNQLAAFLASG